MQAHCIDSRCATVYCENGGSICCNMYILDAR